MRENFLTHDFEITMLWMDLENNTENTLGRISEKRENFNENRNGIDTYLETHRDC